MRLEQKVDVSCNVCGALMVEAGSHGLGSLAGTVYVHPCPKCKPEPCKRCATLEAQLVSMTNARDTLLSDLDVLAEQRTELQEELSALRSAQTDPKPEPWVVTKGEFCGRVPSVDNKKTGACILVGGLRQADGVANSLAERVASLLNESEVPNEL